ncbi:hypothetical protein LR48_Vigan09g066800 [Vigna angularis]|uniref:Uncharacterized protein n=1 Tax=Phaseolus angularis TaxID=3914 RepID=A0A0L9VBJ7_PHAAN|nr:hypothetical protein LR48_Vigan09g066800 [Vigna angularis]
MTSSSSRRMKTAGNKRKEKEQYYSHQFRTAAHERGEQELLRMFTSAFPDRKFISQEEFVAMVAYSEGPAHADGGAAGGDAADEEEDSDD